MYYSSSYEEEIKSLTCIAEQLHNTMMICCCWVLIGVIWEIRKTLMCGALASVFLYDHVSATKLFVGFSRYMAWEFVNIYSVILCWRVYIISYMYFPYFFALYQASAAKYMRTALSWVIMQRVMVIYYRSFWTSPEDGTNRLSRKSVRNYHHSLHNSPEDCSYPSYLLTDLV